jgi:hypothetical protein
MAIDRYFCKAQVVLLGEDKYLLKTARALLLQERREPIPGTK